MNQDKHKAESWDDLKNWLKRLKKTRPNFKEFTDLILGGMKVILGARQEAVVIVVKGGIKTEYTGMVKHETTEDGEYTDSIAIEDNNILHSIWSIFEHYHGKVIRLTIEELKEAKR